MRFDSFPEWRRYWIWFFIFVCTNCRHIWSSSVHSLGGRIALIASWASRRIASRLLFPPGGEGGSGTGPGVVAMMDRLVFPPVGPVEAVCNCGNSSTCKRKLLNRIKTMANETKDSLYDTVQSSLLFSCCRHSAHAPEWDCHISTAKTKCPPNVLTFSLHLAVSLWTSFQIKAATVKRDSFYFTALWCKFYEVFIKEFDMDQTTKPTTAQSQLPFLIYLCKVDEIFGRVTSLDVESKLLHCPINWCVLISSLSRFTSFRHHMKIFVNNFCFRNQTKRGKQRSRLKRFLLRSSTAGKMPSILVFIEIIPRHFVQATKINNVAAGSSDWYSWVDGKVYSFL